MLLLLLLAVVAAVVNSTCQDAAAAGARQLLHAFLLFTWEPANSLSLSCCYSARCSGYSAVSAPIRLTLPTVNSSARPVPACWATARWEGESAHSLSAACRRSVCATVWALTAYAVEISQSSSVSTTVRCRRVERMLRLYHIAPVFRVKFRVVFIRIAKPIFLL